MVKRIFFGVNNKFSRQVAYISKDSVEILDEILIDGIWEQNSGIILGKSEFNELIEKYDNIMSKQLNQ